MNMTIKPNCGVIIQSVLFGMFFLFTLILAIIEPSDIRWWLMTFLSFVIFVIVLVVTCRTLKFDSEGITVSLLFFKKIYLWNDIKTKRICDYSELGKTYQTGIYNMGAEFCVSTLKRRGRKMPYDYCLFNHCFSFIFVSFRESKSVSGGKVFTYPLWYEVSQRDFVELLKNLKIEVEYIKY
jgi:hypothetical protein